MAWLKLTDATGKPVFVNMTQAFAMEAGGEQTTISMNVEGRAALVVKEKPEEILKLLGREF